MVIWKDVPVIIRIKQSHFRKNFNPKNRRKSFMDDLGDIPICRINEITGCIEEVVNTRGYGYAKRNDLKFRKKLRR